MRKLSFMSSFYEATKTPSGAKSTSHSSILTNFNQPLVIDSKNPSSGNEGVMRIIRIGREVEGGTRSWEELNEWLGAMHADTFVTPTSLGKISIHYLHDVAETS